MELSWTLLYKRTCTYSLNFLWSSVFIDNGIELHQKPLCTRSLLPKSFQFLDIFVIKSIFYQRHRILLNLESTFELISINRYKYLSRSVFSIIIHLYINTRISTLYLQNTLNIQVGVFPHMLTFTFSYANFFFWLNNRNFGVSELLRKF